MKLTTQMAGRENKNLLEFSCDVVAPEVCSTAILQTSFLFVAKLHSSNLKNHYNFI